VIADGADFPKERRAQIDSGTAELLPKIMQRLGLRERLHETEVIDAWSNRRRIYRRALRASRVARRRSLCPRPAAGRCIMS